MNTPSPKPGPPGFFMPAEPKPEVSAESEPEPRAEESAEWFAVASIQQSVEYSVEGRILTLNE